MNRAVFATITIGLTLLTVAQPHPSAVVRQPTAAISFTASDLSSAKKKPASQKRKKAVPPPKTGIASPVDTNPRTGGDGGGGM